MVRGVVARKGPMTYAWVNWELWSIVWSRGLIWTTRRRFEPWGWDLGLEAGIWALRLEFRPHDWDLREGDEEEEGGGGEGENPPYL